MGYTGGRQTLPSYEMARRVFFSLQDRLHVQLLDDALRFEISNVAKWTHQVAYGNAIEGTRVPLEDILRSIPNVAPVAESMWFEFAPCTPLNKEEAVSHACHMQVIADEQTYPGSIESFRKYSKFPDPAPAGTRWVVRAETFMLSKERTEGLFVGDYLYFIWVGGDGKWLGVHIRVNPVRADHCEYASIIEEEVITSCAALGFMHCKNVTTTEHRPSRQVVRAAERSGLPVITFKTLEIGPMTRALSDEGGIAQHGIVRALHICRGHFSHYTDEKPLFGKYTGTFYIPQHVRGTLKAGAVVKDYKVVR